MLTDQPGRIAEGLYLLGRQENLMYLVRGQKNMIIGGGMTWIIPELEEQLGGMGIGSGDIDYLVVQHAHFDHIGAIPYLLRCFPSIKVLGTAAAKTTLAKEKIIQYMELANKVMAGYKGSSDCYEKYDMRFSLIKIDGTVGNDTVIDLGKNLRIEFIEVPGHSPCALAVYIPSLKAIFPTDAALCPVGSIDRLARPSPQYDYSLYKQSLQKILSHDIEICCFDHYAAVLGTDAGQVLLNAVRVCSEFEKRVIDLYRETGDLEKVAIWVGNETMRFTQFTFQTEEVMLPVSRAVARNILKAASMFM